MTPPTFSLDQINPLRGLGAQEVINEIEKGQRGYYARLQWLYYFIEKKDPMVRAVKRRLLGALRGLDWDIKQADTGEDAQKKALAEKQAIDLRKRYDAIQNLRDALNFLALGELRGFSHLEKIYAGAGAADPWLVTELRIVEQWFWARNGSRGPWLYNGEAAERNDGTPIDPANFIIYEIDDPADEIFAEMAIKRKVNDADWDGFLEDYGVPAQFIVGPQNVPADKEKEYQRVAEEAVSRRRGYLPFGSTLETPTATGSGGAGVFSERLKYIDEQIVIAGTSGKLSILAERGTGTLAGGAQKEAFDEIAQAIANNISGALQDQFDKPLLARLYPNQPVLAYFEMSKVDTEDTSDLLKDAGLAADAGFAMDEKELSEKSGYSLRYVGVPGPGGAPTNLKPPVENKPAAGAAAPVVAPTATDPTAPAQPAIAPADPENLNTLIANAQAQIAEADAADLVPLRRALESAIANPTPERLQALLDQLPDIQTKIGDRGAAARANSLGTALASGLSS